MANLKPFVFDQSESYWYPVVVNVLDENGKQCTYGFYAKFKRLSADEKKEIFNPDDGRKKGDGEILDQVFLSWRGIERGKGEELAYSAELRPQLLQMDGVQPGLVTAWLKSLGIEGKQKN